MSTRSPGPGSAPDRPATAGAPAPGWPVTWRLADGRRLCARPLDPTDREAYRDVDHDRHEAHVAYECGSGRAIGIARYVRLPGDRSAADVAVTVIDEWQGHGIGRSLLALLTRRAADAGIRRLHADALRENRRALRLLRGIGFRVVGWEGVMATLERTLVAPAQEDAGGPALGGLRPAA